MKRSKRALVLMPLIAAACLGTAMRRAEIEVPAAIAARADRPAQVTGHNPRTWGRPLAFGEYRTVEVDEKADFSWSIAAFGVRGGTARQAYLLRLEGPTGQQEIDCRARSIEIWRDGLSIELTDAFTPRLACAFRDASGAVSRLILASDGRELRGDVEDPATGATLLRVSSIHHLVGGRWRVPEPAGYLVESQTGEPVAALEIINRGRVWLTPEAASGPAAAAIAALLLYRPDLTAQLD